MAKPSRKAEAGEIEALLEAAGAEVELKSSTSQDSGMAGAFAPAFSMVVSCADKANGQPVSGGLVAMKARPIRQTN